VTLEELRVLLIEAVARGVAPRLDAAIWIEGDLRELSSSDGAPAVFDLASLTKPLATGLVALSLAAEGKLALEAPLTDGGTARQLLDHSAGYEAWAPLFLTCLADPEARRAFGPPQLREAAFARCRRLMREQVAARRPVAVPGSKTLYGDVGFLKLQQLLEREGNASLDRLLLERVTEPLGLDLHFVDLTQPPAQPSWQPLPGSVAATGAVRPRPPAAGQEEALAGVPAVEVGRREGEVDDDNAFALGGVAGHAGLFGTAGAVALAGARFLEECEGRGRLAPAQLALAFCGPSGPGGRGLAWDRVSPESSLGTLLGRGPEGAVGHLGFTGTSLWVDRTRRIAVALCSNRVLHGRENQMIRDFRPRFHDAVAHFCELA
jgi:serine-type D-Ala-D-Ala carboxypeptidase